MKLGLLAVSSKTGLGYQTKDYFKFLSPTKTLIVDISSINGSKQHYEWYPGAKICRGFPQQKDLKEFLRGLDVVLTAETPYNFELFPMAKERGVKTVCVENPEFYDYFKYPHLPMPDMMILPSSWKEGEIRSHAEPLGTKVVQLHHPVDRDVFKFRLRSQKRLVHIAGNPAVHDRNGTFDALNASGGSLLVYVQKEAMARMLRARYSQSRVIEQVEDNIEMYQMGDVLVFPRKYGGNCLPLNEALSCGMPVIMPDINPNNDLLPSEWLVPASVTGHFEPRAKVDIYTTDLQALRDKIDWFRSCDITEESKKADKIAESISWKVMLPKWRKVLEELCSS